MSLNHSIGTYLGGKFKIRQWIHELLLAPEYYNCFAEPFAGFYCITVSKEKTSTEIYNDYNKDIYTFFKVLRENHEQLIQFLEAYPYSRQVHDDFEEKWRKKEYKSEIEHAGIIYYLLQNSINSYLGNTYKTSISHDDAARFKRQLDRLIDVKNRLREVVLENRDFEKFITSYDSPGTLFYVDPPYLNAESYYKTGFNRNDHIRLAKVLNSTKGFVALSYYEEPELNKWYSPDKWFTFITQSMKHSAYLKQGKENLNNFTTEVLLTNYDPSKFRSNKSSIKDLSRFL